MTKESIIHWAFNNVWMTKRKEKSIYHTKSLKPMKWVATQNICMQTHLTYLQYPEKYYQLSCLFLDILYDKPRRQHFPVFIRAPC